MATATAERRYAEGTKVSASQTIEEIKKSLRKYGATSFAQAETPDRIALMFVINYGDPDERQIRFTLDLSMLGHFNKTPSGRARSGDAAKIAQEVEMRRLWRALGAAIKGKLIAVDENIETIEEAFYNRVIMPSGRTIYEETHEAVSEAYERRLMPSVPMLALPSSG